MKVGLPRVLAYEANVFCEVADAIKRGIIKALGNDFRNPCYPFVRMNLSNNEVAKIGIDESYVNFCNFQLDSSTLLPVWADL